MYIILKHSLKCEVICPKSLHGFIQLTRYMYVHKREGEWQSERVKSESARVENWQQSQSSHRPHGPSTGFAHKQTHALSSS